MDKKFIARILADTTDFTRGIAKCVAMVEQLDDSKNIDIDANTKSAEAQIARMQKELRSVPNIIRMKADLGGNANIKLAQLNKTLRTVPKKVDTDLDVDTAGAVAGVMAYKAELKSIPNSVETNVRIDRNGMLQAAMAATLLKKKLSGLTSGALSSIGPKFANASQGVNVLYAALAALAPAIIPIIATLVPAIMAIGNAIAVVGGGAIGLAGAFGIAGAGALLFGALATSAISMLNDGLLAATKETMAYTTALDGLKAAWTGVIQDNQAAIFTTLANGINVAKTALQSLAPFITGVANEMASLSAKMLEFFQTSSIAQGFFNMINTTGVSVFKNVASAAGQFGAGFMAIITQFGPLFDWMAQGLANMATQFQAWATSVGTANGIQQFIEYTKTNLPVIGEIFGNTFEGIFNLFKAFGSNSQTIFSALSDMTARFAEWSASIGQSQGFQQFIDYVQTQGPVVMSTIGNIVNAVVAFATAMAPLGAAVLGVVSSVAQWIAGFAQAHPVITQIVGAVMAFGGILLKIASVVSSVVGIFGGWSAVLSGLGTVFTFLTGPIGLTIAAVVAVGTAIYLLWTKCDAFRNGLIALGQGIMQVGSMIMSGLGAALSFVGSLLMSVISSVIAFGAALISGIGSALSGLGSAVMSAISSAVSAVSSGFSNMLSVASSIMSSISSAVSSAWSAIVGAVSGFISSVVSAVSSGFSNMLSTASSIMSSISSAISSAWSAIVSAISSFISSAVSAVTSGFSNMMSAVSSFASNLISSITSAMSSFVSAISSGASQAISAITTMISGILSAVTGAAGQMVSAGADLVRGFINGIQSMAGAALDAARNMAANAVNAVKGMLKIGSPSKVLKQIGQWLTQGFAIGIRKDIPKVETAIQRMLRPVTKGLAALKSNDYDKSKDGASQVYSLMNKRIEDATKQLDSLAKKRKDISEKIASSSKKLSGKMSIQARAKEIKNINALRKQYASLGKAMKVEYKKRKLNRDLKAEIRPMMIYMTRISKKREELAKKLEVAKDKLQDAIDKRTDFKNMIRDDLRGYASVTNTGRKTSQGMVKMMTKRLADIKKYQATIGSLAKLGLNKTTMQEILDAGIEQGSAYATGIFKGGKSAVNEINKLQSQINSASNSMATTNADRFYKAGVDAAKGVVKGLQAQDAALAKVATKIADVISKTIKKRLGIKSPSRVMIGLMDFVGAGLVNGIMDNVKTVGSAASKLSAAIEKNIDPDVNMPNMNLGSQVSTMNSTITSDLKSSMKNAEVSKQPINIYIKNEADIPAIVSEVEQVQALNASVTLIG